jgi:hypothetical protein
VLVFFAISGWQRQGSGSAIGLANSDASNPIFVNAMKQSLAQERRQLIEYEREQSALRAEVIRRRKLYQEGRLAQDQVADAEKSFVELLKRVHELRHTVDEADIAVTEAVLGEKVLRMPALPQNGFSETAELAHFNGGFKWSLREAPRLEKYYSQAFGRRLPVTAMGQTTTHNRLGFDHRDAMDVALHPDSKEARRSSVTFARQASPCCLFARRHGRIDRSAYSYRQAIRTTRPPVDSTLNLRRIRLQLTFRF